LKVRGMGARLDYELPPTEPVSLVSKLRLMECGTAYSFSKD